MNLSEKILSLRKSNGLSQEELAERLGVSRQAVSRWESVTALPDASNILLLSRLFGVATDYLLCDEYESDRDIPAVKMTEKASKIKIQKIIGWCAAALGLLGNLIIFIISRAVEVMIPNIISENGETVYYWSEDLTGHSYKYFIDAYSLEFLTALFWGLVIFGIAYANRDRMKALFGRIKSKI